MPKKIDQVLVVDIEATCWENNPPKGMESEIIEVGICVVDIPAKQKIEKASILVLPEISDISEYCTNLTTITAEMLEQKAIKLDKACNILKKDFISKERTWFSWGDYDRRIFEKQCLHKNIKYPFGLTHVNLKYIFAIFMGLNEEVSLDQALKILNIELEGTHHRGDDDAWNTASILIKMLSYMQIPL